MTPGVCLQQRLPYLRQHMGHRSLSPAARECVAIGNCISGRVESGPGDYLVGSSRRQARYFSGPELKQIIKDKYRSEMKFVSAGTNLPFNTFPAL